MVVAAVIHVVSMVIDVVMCVIIAMPIVLDICAVVGKTGGDLPDPYHVTATNPRKAK